jgi:asparagine synthase (glutamine-hydrolysing)
MKSALEFAGDQHGAVARDKFAVGVTGRRSQPAAISQGSDVSVVLDGRIHNAADVLGDLGLDPAAYGADEAVIAAAWRRWGNDCAAHFEGEFALVVVDHDERIAYIARDHMGTKPLYYARAAGVFAFCSQIRGLLSLAEVPRRLNEQVFGNHLVYVPADQVSTLYQGVHRLAPAHWMAVKPHNESSERYWSPSDIAEVAMSPADCGEGYRAVLRRAIDRRLDGAASPGALLSGGLDTSSIVSAATQLCGVDGLKTISAVFPVSKESDESSYIAAVHESGGLEPSFVEGEPLDLFMGRSEGHWVDDEPYFSPIASFFWANITASAARSVDVLLDGLGGDATVGVGLAHVTELATSLRLVQFARALTDIRRSMDIRYPVLLRYFLLRPLAPPWLRIGLHRLRHRDALTALAQSPLRAHFVARSGLRDRVREGERLRASIPRNAREEHLQDIGASAWSTALEGHGRLALWSPVEPTYPLMDRPLMEFCLAAPGSLKFESGRSRNIPREALTGVLPELVRQRLSKANLVGPFDAALAGPARPVIEGLFRSEGGPLAEFVDIARARGQYEQFLAGATRLRDAVWQVACLGLWLEDSGLV